MKRSKQMPKYIDGDALTAILKRKYDYFMNEPDDADRYGSMHKSVFLTALSILIEIVDKQPEVEIYTQVDNTTIAEWIVCGSLADTLRCSSCGYRRPRNDEVFDYCPHCGAKMEE